MPLPYKPLSLVASLLVLGVGNSLGDPIFTTRINDAAPHVRVGVSVRKINADFAVSPTSAFGGAFLAAGNRSVTTSGPGDPGLFLGGPNQVVYSDGSVGGEPVFDDGDAISVINSLSQLNPSARPTPDGSDFDLQEVLFHSSETVATSILSNQVSMAGGAGTTSRFSDEVVTGGLYTELVFPCLAGPEGRFLNFVLGYSFYEASLGTGYRGLGSQLLRTRATNSLVTTDYEYRYDYLGPAGPGDPFPFSGFGLVYDPDLFSAFVLGDPDDFLPPSKTSTSTRSSSSTMASLLVFGFSQTSVEVDLHEIPLGFECGCDLGWGTLAFNTGATINIVNLHLQQQTDWFLSGNPNPILTQVSRSSETPVQFGGYVGASLTCPLTPDGRLLFEAHASYRWVDPVEASIGSATIDLDLSSWEGGMGFVHLF